MFELTDREKSILRDIIHQFILTANPVGSRNIAKKSDLHLSAATIRNIMADLEDAGFLLHPHTSAGRVPTDRGYRLYVDSLMPKVGLNSVQKDIISQELESVVEDTDDLIKLTASVLSKLTNQLACITYPNISHATLKKIQIVQLSSTRILVVVQIESGLIKTITLEVSSEIDSKRIHLVQQFLNERLAGYNFEEIRTTFSERIRDYRPEFNPIIRVFFDSVDKIFKDTSAKDKIYITGGKNIVKQPEFETPEHYASVIELIEDKDVVVHIMEKQTLNGSNDLIVNIGEEIASDKFSNYSTVTKNYKFGKITGTLGIIGPKRMEYSRTIAAVVYLAELLSKELRSI